MMNMTKSRKLLSSILCIVLIAAMALFTIGCSDNKKTDGTQAVTTEAQTEVPQTVTTEAQTEVLQTEEQTQAPGTEEVTEVQTEADTVLGEGETEFLFTVTDADGNEKYFEIHTDKTIVGEALLELGLISGEDGAYGLYVNIVDGIEADYDKDGTYWAFYVDGEYGMTGVDMTDIVPGSTYSFKVEK